MNESLARKTNTAQKYFDAGVSEAKKGHAAWNSFRSHIFDAGLYFTKARDAAPDGEWGMLLDMNTATIKSRTVRFYMELTAAALEWARTEMPNLKGEKLLEEARKVMMLSPKPLVSLLRDLRLMRPFGEYDEVKYRLSKNSNPQLELRFDKVWAPLDLLDRLDEAKVIITDLPEGKTEHQALAEIQAKCEHIAKKICAQLKTIEV